MLIVFIFKNFQYLFIDASPQLRCSFATGSKLCREKENSAWILDGLIIVRVLEPSGGAPEFPTDGSVQELLSAYN